MYNKCMEEKKIQVRFPPETWEALKQLAERHNRSFNGEIIWALRGYVAQQKGEAHEGVQISSVSDQSPD